MKLLQAVVVIGIFGWAAFGVYFGPIAFDTGYTRGLIPIAIDSFGSEWTAYVLAAFGLFAALSLVSRQEPS